MRRKHVDGLVTIVCCSPAGRPAERRPVRILLESLKLLADRLLGP